MVPSTASYPSSIGRWTARALRSKVLVAMSLSILLGVIPLRIIAQSPDRGTNQQARGRSGGNAWREAARDTTVTADTNRIRSGRGSQADRPTEDRDEDSSVGERPRLSKGTNSTTEGPPGFAIPSYANTGQVWHEYNLAPYTNRLAGQAHPEQAVVDWVLRQTGPETWYGEEIAVLSATRGRLRVFHRSDIQDQVAQIVDRFTRPVQGQVSIRVQFATTTDLNWRSNLAHLIRPIAYGSDGQQVWLIAPEDAALIRNRIPQDRSVGSLSQQITAKNGQETGVESGHSVTYISGLELGGSTYLAYQPLVSRLQEGVRLTFMPLWTSDGSAVDVVVNLTTRVVQKLHYAQAAVPLSLGNQEAVMQVPETVATHFEQTLRWPTSQVLLISAGMQPPNLTSRLASRRGTFSFGPAAVELLMLAELAPPYSSRAVGARNSIPDQ